MTNATIYNLERWSDEKVLFITGMPGVGKTTFSNRLSDYDYAKIIHVDDFRDNIGNLNWREKGIRIKSAIESIKERTIVEGTGVLYIDHDWLKDRPIIIFESPFYLRFIRYVYRRVTEDKKSLWYSIYHGIRLNKKWIRTVSSFQKNLSTCTSYKLTKQELSLGSIPSYESINENKSKEKYANFSGSNYL